MNSVDIATVRCLRRFNRLVDEVTGLVCQLPVTLHTGQSSSPGQVDSAPGVEVNRNLMAAQANLLHFLPHETLEGNVFRHAMHGPFNVFAHQPRAPLRRSSAAWAC